MPVLKLPILSPAAYPALQGKPFSRPKQMVATAHLALGAASCQGATCSPIKTSFAVSGNCPLFIQKLCHQTLGAKGADDLSLALRFLGLQRNKGASASWDEGTKAGEEGN